MWGCFCTCFLSRRGAKAVAATKLRADTSDEESEEEEQEARAASGRPRTRPLSGAAAGAADDDPMSQVRAWLCRLCWRVVQACAAQQSRQLRLREGLQASLTPPPKPDTYQALAGRCWQAAFGGFYAAKQSDKPAFLPGLLHALVLLVQSDFENASMGSPVPAAKPAPRQQRQQQQQQHRSSLRASTEDEEPSQDTDLLGRGFGEQPEAGG